MRIGSGRGNEEWNHSTPHGAGRLLTRAEARACIAPAVDLHEILP
ncbi:MAG: RtcB family protein [Akkermansia sp.]|nr:RtcB family protein [Akkermansia sp.]